MLYFLEVLAQHICCVKVLAPCERNEKIRMNECAPTIKLHCHAKSRFYAIYNHCN